MESRRIFFDGNMLYGNSVIQESRTMMNTEETSKRRLCFSTVEGEELMFHEEYYEEPLPEKKRRLTAEQVQLLEKRFQEENRLEPERKIEVAKEMGLPPRQVAVWFQNRRSRWKTKQLERSYDKLKSSYDSLASKYEIVLKENDMLKAEFFSFLVQIISLMEKLKHRRNEPGEHHQTDSLVVDIRARAAEDHLSSDGSAILDEGEYLHHQFPDSGNQHEGCNVVEGGSSSYFADLFAAMEAPDDWFECKNNW